MQHPAKKKNTSSKNRRKLMLILLTVCLALSVSFVLLLPAIRQWFPARKYAEPTREMHQELLASEDHEQLRSIAVQHIEGDGYTLEYSGGQLMLRRGEALLDLNDAVEEEMLEAATTVAISDTVAKDAAEVEAFLPEMGLEPAQTTVRVSYMDGREITLELGYGVPGTSYYYYRWSGGAGVYMCDVGIDDIFSMTENQLLPVSQPVLTKALIDHVEIANAAGNMELAFVSDESGYTTGFLKEPYAYPLHSEGMNAALTALENLRLGTLEGPVTEDNRASYGFDNPLCRLAIHQSAGAYTTVDEMGQLSVGEMPEQELRFTFGKAQGEYFYTCEYEGNAYLVSRILVEVLVEATPDKWITRNPADMGGMALSAIVVQAAGEELDIRINRATRVLPNSQLETDADGNVIYDVEAVANGQPMAQEQLDALVGRLSAMTASGDVPSGWSPGSASPRWRMRLTTEGGVTRTIEAYRMDVFSDALMVDGVIRHYAYMEALDMALGELAAFVLTAR